MATKIFKIKELRRIIKETINEDVNLRADNKKMRRMGSANISPEDFKAVTDAGKLGAKSIKGYGYASHAYNKAQSAVNKALNKSNAMGGFGNPDTIIDIIHQHNLLNNSTWEKTGDGYKIIKSECNKIDPSGKSFNNLLNDLNDPTRRKNFKVTPDPSNNGDIIVTPV